MPQVQSENDDITETLRKRNHEFASLNFNAFQCFLGMFWFDE